MAETTILVTDSGLGGLSVLAGIANGFQRTRRFDRVNLVYFNAWPSQHKGYNHYPGMAERAQVFHNALEAMAGFRPDAIFIACNTLSVIYPLTRFSHSAAMPVTGIVDHGIEMAAEKLAQDPGARVVIFGTPTTIEGDSHRSALIRKGFAPERIIPRACVNLAGKIERNPFGDEVKKMIDENARMAAQDLGAPQGKVYAALCCTHFGYCANQFAHALARHSGADIGILNPNQRMADLACRDQDSAGAPNLDIRIFSRVTWEKERIRAYEKLLTPVSPMVAGAIKDYTLDRDLFTLEF